jgi:hypothetical protein
MDDRKTSIFSHDPDGRIGADAAPIAPPIRPSTDLEHKLVLRDPDQARRSSVQPLLEERFVVYCGDEQRVSEGFAIALRAMGVEGHVGLPGANQDREDD